MQRVTQQPSVNSLQSHAKESRLSSCHELLQIHTVATKKTVYRGKKKFNQQPTFLRLNNKSPLTKNYFLMGRKVA